VSKCVASCMHTTRVAVRHEPYVYVCVCLSVSMCVCLSVCSHVLRTVQRHHPLIISTTSQPALFTTDTLSHSQSVQPLTRCDQLVPANPYLQTGLLISLTHTHSPTLWPIKNFSSFLCQIYINLNRKCSRR